MASRPREEARSPVGQGGDEFPRTLFARRGAAGLIAGRDALRQLPDRLQTGT